MWPILWLLAIQSRRLPCRTYVLARPAGGCVLRAHGLASLADQHNFFFVNGARFNLFLSRKIGSRKFDGTRCFCSNFWIYWDPCEFGSSVYCDILRTIQGSSDSDCWKFIPNEDLKNVKINLPDHPSWLMMSDRYQITEITDYPATVHEPLARV